MADLQFDTSKKVLPAQDNAAPPVFDTSKKILPLSTDTPADKDKTILALYGDAPAFDTSKKVLPGGVPAPQFDTSKKILPKSIAPTKEPLTEFLPDDPNKTYASILPVSKDKTTGKVEAAVPSILRDVVHNFELPGKVTAGQVSDEDMEKGARDLALQTALSPVGHIGKALAKDGIKGAAESMGAGEAPLSKEPIVPKAETPKPQGDLPERTADDLFKLKNQDEVRRIGYVQNLKQIKDVPNETWEKLYAHKDSPETVTLSPEEQALYQKHIEPIAKRSEEILSEFKKDGHDLSEDYEDNYGAPRQVKDKNASVEKIYGNAAAAKRIGGGKKISTYSPAAQSRSMWALPGKAGERSVVYVQDGKLFKNGESIGEVLDKDTRPGAGVETSLGKLQQATTAEIEADTNLQYHKNLLANEYLRAQSLERANDAKNFITKLKTDPEFLEHATLAGNRNAPEAWRAVPGIKEFEGYKFDPKMAEVIEDYMGNLKSPEDYTNAVMNIAKATKASIFYNPIRHMVNATNMFATSKGVVGTLRDLPHSAQAMTKAVKSVLTQDKDFREMAKAGLSLPSARNTAEKFNKELTRAMGIAIRKEPKKMAEIAKDWGYKSTAGLVKALYAGSSKILWSYSDILAMTRVNEYMARGLSRAEAIRKTEQVLANYRVPSRVAGSRNASKILQSPEVTLFGRYDYNRFANLAGMVKRAASKDPGAWEARDQLLALAAITTFGYKVVDKALQKETGNDEARYPMGGYSQLVDVANDVWTGKKSVPQGLQSLFAPGLLAVPLEAVTGENMYTGKPVAQRADFMDLVNGIEEGDFDQAKTGAARLGFDLTKEMVSKFAPINEAAKYFQGDTSPEQFWLEQAGAKMPTDEAQAGAEKAEKYSAHAGRSAAKKRPDWVP